MKSKNKLVSVGIAVSLAILAAGAAMSAQDKYTVKVPGGLGFAEFKGYESWQTISVSHNGDHMAVILGNPAMLAAYQAGIPGRYVQAGHHGELTTTEQRCQVRVRVSHDSESPGLRFHGVRPQMKLA